MKIRIALAATAAAALLALSALAGSAQATPYFKLRVEIPGATLDPGTHYATPRSILARRGRLSGNSTGTCVAATGRHEIDGQTALGLAASAANGNKALQPLLVAEDAFGRRICRIGDGIEADSPSFSGWLFRHNHSAPPLSGELVSLDRGSDVLWVFADFGTGANTGDELVITVPVRAQPGLVPVTVQAITFDGAVAPAPDGTVITGGSAAATTTGGVANVPLAAGDHLLRAVGGPGGTAQIPSNQESVCVAERLEDCPAARGIEIVGSQKRDGLKGGDGPDTIRARGGNDKIRVKGGDADKVNCGKGRDRVVADEQDRLRRCERVSGAEDGSDDKKGSGKKK
jgi:hypothetical protein